MIEKKEKGRQIRKVEKDNSRPYDPIGKMVGNKMSFDSYKDLTLYVYRKYFSRDPLGVVEGEKDSTVERWELISKINASWSGGVSNTSFSPHLDSMLFCRTSLKNVSFELMLPLAVCGL